MMKKLFKSLLVFLLVLSWIIIGRVDGVRAATTGAKYPTLGETVSEAPWSDNTWTTPTNIYSDNAATANVTATSYDSPDQTYVLKATGFDFSEIPDGSTINGVIARVNSWYRSGQGSGSMDLCQLLDTSKSKVGTNQCSSAVALTTTNTTVITKGSSSDLWGNSLTASWVKSANFGIAIGILATAANADVDVDYVTLEIYYTPPVVLGNGASEPGNNTIAPGGNITDLDNFTLAIGSGTDTVTAMTVTLAPDNAYNNIAQVDITDESNNAKCTAVSGLTSNVVTFGASTCNIPVTTTVTTYKIRITPKTPTNMPGVPGASYATTGTVTAFTSTNPQTLGDSGSSTITIDNLSPDNVSGVSGSLGSQQVSPVWTIPGDADYHSALVLRREGSAVGDTPQEGTTYNIGDPVGSSTVACVVADPNTTCTDSGLVNGTTYHYKIFAKDSNGNYSQTGVVPTGSPFTPYIVSISLTTDGSVPFGIVPLSGTKHSGPADMNHPETINVSGGPVTLRIKSTNFTEGGNTWVLSSGNGANQVKWEFSKDGSVWTTFSSPAPTDYSFDTPVAQGQTRNVYLKITMPTSTASYNQYSSSVTMVASYP